MIKLPLYPELPKRPIQEVEPLDRNADCARCSLYQVNPAGSRCIAANGQLGDILVIGDSPTELERKTGLAFTSSTGKQLRKLLGELAPGRNVVYTYALGCKPGRDTDFDQAVSMCRPYLAKVIEECNPKIILLVGSLAGSSVLDLGYNWQDIRNGFAWLHRDTGSIPVYMLPTLSQGYRNHLVMKALREDLRKALVWGPHNTYRLALTASYAIIDDARGAEQAYAELKSAGLVVATDVETSGMMFEPDFRIECLAVANRDFAYVFSRRCLEDSDSILWLRRILQELDHTSWNGQYDLCAIECERLLHPNGRDLKRPLLNLQSDARLKRKIGDSEAAGDLATCANLVGMGGHKDEQHGALEAICGELRALALATTLTPTGRTRKAPRCLSVDPTQVPKQWLRWLNDGYSPHKFAHRFVPKHIEHRYVALDAYSTVLLEELCTANLLDQEDEGQITIWEEVTKPSMYAWARAKLNGFPTDKGAVQLFSDYLKSEAGLCLKKIHAYKPDLNPRSSQQVGKFLNDLGLKSKRKTDSNEQSWSKDVLEGMKDKHPIIPLLLRYKLLTHTDTNFAGGMLSDIRSDGRVHPSYLQDGTASGRPSCIAKGTPIEIVRDVSKQPLGTPIEDVKVGDYAYAFDDDLKLVIRKVTAVIPNGVKKVLRLHWQGSGHQHKGYLDLTADHLVRRTDGTYVRADNLHVGERVMALHRGVKGRHGYGRLWPTGGGEIRDHRLVYSETIGGNPEHVHHKNGNKLDNRPENLEGLTHKDHTSHHAKTRSPEALAKMGNTIHQKWVNNREEMMKIHPRDGSNNGRYLGLTKEWILTELTRFGGATVKMARAHGLDYATLQKYMKEHSIDRREFKKLCKQRNHEIVRIEELSESVEVYDLTIDDVHNFIASEICVHNCTDPNFFNRLKGRDAQSRELGNMLRSCHKAPTGWSIIEADMGQIEIRLAAYLSQDAAMIAMLNSGVDFHTRSAELFAPYMGKDLSKMTQEEKDIFRENCKTSNFAAIYEIPSQLGFMLSKRLGIDKGPANDLGRAMFKTYTGLRRFMDTSYAEAYANGYTRTHWKGKPARKRPMIGMGKNPPTLSDLEKELRFNRGDDQGTDEDSPESSGGLDVTAARGTYNTDVQGCYPGHMRILTKSGYIPIIEAPEFGEVWTGSAWKPYKRLDRGEAQLADIYLSNGHIHHCDVRHKLLTETADGYEFKHYSDLQPGDKVCLSLAQPREFGDSPVSTKEAYWMGFAIGNGCTRQRNLLAVTFGDRKGRYNRIDKSNEFREFVHGIGFQDRNDFVKSGCLTVNVESKELRERWEELGYPWGCLARDKSIPTCIWTANLEARKQFLIGLLDADGTVGSKRSAANLHMASRELLQQAQLLFRTVGVTSVLLQTTATSWRLCLNSMQASQELAYGMCGGTKLIISDERVPAFLVRKFIELCPKWPSADRSGYTLHSRMKSGGYTNIYTFLDMAKTAGVDLGTPIYSTSRVVKKVDLGTTETTYTLSVSDPGHRFDCEGVIAKNSAVDIITSMLKPVTDWLDANTDGGQFILQIYDSIMLLVKDEDLDKTLKFLVSLMKDEQEPKVGYVSGIPLVVDVKVGKSWDSLKKVKLT